jgi:uncharacterized protein YegP (UPF0339 family)
MANEQKYEIWKSSDDDRWYWRFKAGNGEQVATGDGYVSRQDALHAIRLVQKSDHAKIYSLTPRDVP